MAEAYNKRWVHTILKNRSSFRMDSYAHLAYKEIIYWDKQPVDKILEISNIKSKLNRTGVVDLHGQQRRLPWATDKAVQPFRQAVQQAVSNTVQRHPNSFLTGSFQPLEFKGICVYRFDFDGKQYHGLCDTSNISSQLPRNCRICDKFAFASGCSFRVCKKCCMSSFQDCLCKDHQNSKSRSPFHQQRHTFVSTSILSYISMNKRVSVQFFGGRTPGRIRSIEPTVVDGTSVWAVDVDEPEIVHF